MPLYNTCIEYDGKQHYMNVDFQGNCTDEELSEKLKINKKRDKIKDKYCKKNGIKLLRIPYYDFDKIEDILINYLNIDWIIYWHLEKV